MPHFRKVAGTVGDIAVGLSPWVPWERGHGLGAVTPAALTTWVGGGAPGARVLEVQAERDRQTTDRARLALSWNDAGAEAGLPDALFAKGTPSLASSRILNSAFGLCGTEVRFYADVYPEVADLTLRPYHASIGRGGRFLLVLESRDPADTHFHTMAEEADLEHARAVVTGLARLHARFHESPRFGTDLRWVTRYSGRPGQVLAPTILQAAEKRFRSRYDVPPEVSRIIGLHVRHGAELTAIWEAMPSTLCHGDTHLGNTFRTAGGHSGLFDWQEVHRMNGLREIAYFVASAFSPENRRKYEHELLGVYLETLAAAGAPDVPSAAAAFDRYRLLMLDAWRSVWASLALMPVQTDGLAELLIERHCGHLVELDVEQAVRSALAGGPMSAPVLLERHGHVAHVVLNRPEKRNAIDGPMFAALRAVALELGADPGVRAVVLSGAGGTFCSGIDVGALADMGAGAVDGDTVAGTGRLGTSPDGATPFQQAAWAWQELAAPVIAAIEGHAVGGGLNIALGADLRVIAPTARVGFVEITWGLVPDLSATQGLRRLVGLDVAKRLVLTGELVDGREAVDLGLATLVDEDPVARALAIAGTIAGRSPDAVRAAKQLLNQAALVSVADGLAAEVRASAALVGTPNQVEAVLARLEGRDPAFADPA